MLRKLILFILIPFLLTSIWFGPRKIIAHAEEGLLFFNPIRTYLISSHLWQDTGLGFVNLFSTPRITLYIFSAGLSSLKISNFVVQQLIFFLLILVPLVSIPPLTKLLLPDSKSNVGTYAALFYVFNLFFVSQVLQRFIIELFFLWSYLPLFIYLWVRWLESSKLKYLILLILSSVIYSTSFAIIASVFALWIPAGVLWLKYRRFPPLIVGAVIWFLAAIWWWYPLVVIKDNPYNQFLNSAQNLISLVDVSKYYSNSDILLLKQKYYFSPQTIWFNFFSRPPINYLSWVFPILLAVGSIWAIRSRSSRLLIIWLIVGWFFVKGANPPWGTQFYEWLFETLPYCLLMALGLSRIPIRFVRVVIVFAVCFFLLRPMWNGQVFTGYQVKVPLSYELADHYLNSQSNLRLLHLPFVHGSGVGYNWGYLGDEPSEFTFDRPSLSKTYNFSGDPYMLIYQYLRSPNVYRILQQFAIDTAVLHKDILPGVTLQENYAGAKAMIGLMEKVKLTKSFDDLDIYQLEDAPVDWGYLSNNITEVKSLKEGLDMVLNNERFIPLYSAFTLRTDIPNIKQSILPQYQINKISQVHYQFQIYNAASPYFLILSNSFNPLWIARINGLIVTDHFQINGYANGWLINKTGNYTVDITFKVWPWD